MKISSSFTMQLTLAKLPTTGIKILAIATFELKAVMNTAITTQMNCTSGKGKTFKPLKELPSMADMPLLSPPAASAKPPPKSVENIIKFKRIRLLHYALPSKNIRPHGLTLLVNFQLRIKPISLAG